ncbi:interleukin-17C-like [Stegostoma tigrinum]|uniref:interleukin-17C-like n=1 Tax=Stegostoma tigrinum TaxID=3053191 RepID=UPI0028703BDA|nr:interleukin-17C-like [Stegostoma tigrinum]
MTLLSTPPPQNWTINPFPDIRLLLPPATTLRWEGASENPSICLGSSSSLATVARLVSEREGRFRLGVARGVTSHVLVMLLMVDQLWCAKGERRRFGWSARWSHQHLHVPISESEAESYFSRLDSERRAPTSCKEEKGAPHDYSSLSLSPWKYRICTDPDRYPPTIREAECLQKNCVVPGLESSPNFSIRLDSIPLSHTIDVWYWSRSGGRTQLIKKILAVPIGCTCVRQRRLRH